MVLKLHGVATCSGTTYAVVMTLHEKKIPFEIVPVDTKNKAHKTPKFLAIQPFGLVPVIDDDGFVLYESRAICRYLAEKYPDQGTPLIPTDLSAKALFEQAASVEYSNFHPHAFAIYVEGRQKAMRGLKKDQAKYDEAVSKLSAMLQVYEMILSKQRYLAGDNFTLADLFHISFGTLLEPAGCNLMSWWKDLTGGNDRRI
ncbi:thioredoxin-like protein [Mycena pura]|uniref:glutathione transferase n=1 Tax=Mycena pura TaxID=153505 RepID=A0AAD6VCS0_9AGAR|nr:thioredoxin-like protein [Mycena pura]